MVCMSARLWSLCGLLMTGSMKSQSLRAKIGTSVLQCAWRKRSHNSRADDLCSNLASNTSGEPLLERCARNDVHADRSSDPRRLPRCWVLPPEG